MSTTHDNMYRTRSGLLLFRFASWFCDLHDCLNATIFPAAAQAEARSWLDSRVALCVDSHEAPSISGPYAAPVVRFPNTRYTSENLRLVRGGMQNCAQYLGPGGGDIRLTAIC